MQLELALDARAELLLEVHRRLSARYGPTPVGLRFDPVRQMILGIIGARTRTETARRAFARLMARFPRLDVLRDAPSAEIEAILGEVTFADAKAIRIKHALTEITRRRGRIALDQLEALGDAEALTWLEGLPGVGRKVAAMVLNHSTLRRRALVLDVHHLRILRRLGLAGRGDGTAEVYDRIVPHLPKHWGARDFERDHDAMKLHGQTLCRHSRPLCAGCPLTDLCPTGRQM